MTLNLRPAGSLISIPRHVWERPRSSFGAVAKFLGLVKAKRRLDRVDEIACPFEHALVSGAVAENSLDDLAKSRADGVPVILGTPETAAGLLPPPDHDTLERLLAELDRCDADRWIGERLAKLKHVGIEPPRGSWPDDSSDGQRNELASIRRVLGARDFEPEVVIAVLPVGEPALAALHLGYGDWNDCPSSVVHAAFARRWSTSCGAVPVAFAGDIVEYRVARPIVTREQAIAVALEQFAYCPDIVLQGTETIDRLAAGLIGARYWFFWWD